MNRCRQGAAGSCELIAKRMHDGATFRGMLRLMQSDLERTVMECTGGAGAGGIRYAAHVFVPSAATAILFRLSHWVFRLNLRTLAGLIAYFNQRLLGALIYPGSRIGPGLFIPHTTGVTIGVIAGPMLSVYPLCIIGPAKLPSLRADLHGCPVLGENVRIGAQAVICGDIVLGDDVIIGPEAVVETDVPAGSVLVTSRKASPPRGGRRSPQPDSLGAAAEENADLDL